MSENLTPISVPEMLRMTSSNTSVFLEQVADHISKLENQVATLKERICELESKKNDPN